MLIAYIDDMQEEIDALFGYLSEMLSDNTVLHAFHSADEFLRSFSAGKYDIIFLDIYLESTLGIELARKIRETDKDVLLAFCTTSNEFAAESYEVDARYYLQKPFTKEKVKAMLDRIDFDRLEQNRTVTLPDGQSVILRGITHTEYADHICTIHSKKRESIHTRISQAELEGMLCAYPFFLCCTKGVLINLYEVKLQDENCFIMKNGERIPISRRKKKETEEQYAAFRFETMRKDGEV